MFPDPVEASPIEVLSFVHVKADPVTDPARDNNDVVSPLQISSFSRLSTVGLGFTVTTTFCV